MNELKNWLAKAYDQMAERGLTDPDSKPQDVPCETCGTGIKHHWLQKQHYSYWARGSCWKCKEAKDAEKIQARRLSILANAGVPESFRHLTLSSSDLSPDAGCAHVHRLVQDWQPPSWIMITGPVGTGKTAWLTSLFNWLLLENEGWQGSKWVTESDLFQRCDLAHHSNGYTARQAAMTPFIEAPILFIDDAAASRRALTEWQGSAMRNLFDKRHSSNRPTFITTNMTSNGDLSNRYGLHVMSRIIQATNGLVFLGGNDRRINDTR